MLYFAARQIDRHGALGDTCLAATKSIAPDSTAVDVQCRGTSVCLMGIIQCVVASGGRIDITAATVLGADDATIDGDSSKAVYRTHGAGSIEVAHHMTAVDSHRGRATNNTGEGVIFVSFTVMYVGNPASIGIILVRTATATVDIAAVGVGCTTVNLGVGYADGSLVDGHRGIAEGMAVLTAAVERALDVGTGLSVCSTYYNVSVVDPCQVVVDSLRCVNITTRRAEDHAVVLAVGADGTAGDGNRCSTRALFTSCRRAHPIVRHVVSAVIVAGECTHRTVGAATIYIMKDATTTDVDGGIALDESEVDVRVFTEATAIDVAIRGTTLASRTNRTAADRHARTAVNLRQLAAAIDALGYGAFGHRDRGAATDHG